MEYTKSIQNRQPHTWLDWIEQGIKKYEGRLKRDFWTTIKKGDIIRWRDENGHEVPTKVKDIVEYKSFGEAFNYLGSLLVPIDEITSEGVDKLYSQFYTDKDVSKYGVLAIELELF